MKKILFFIAAIAALLFGACQGEDEIVNYLPKMYEQYYETDITITRPVTATDILILTLDGKMVEHKDGFKAIGKAVSPYMGLGLVRDKGERKLELFNADSTRLLHTIILDAEGENTGEVTYLGLVPLSIINKEVPTVSATFYWDGNRLYGQDELMIFTCNVAYLRDNAPLHTIRYTAGDYFVELGNGDNYLPKDVAQGTLSIVRKDDGAEIFSEEITVEQGEKIDIVQLEQRAFIDATIDPAEANPSSTERTKVRFVIDPLLNLSGALRITVSDPEGVTVGTLDFEAKETSGFVEISSVVAYKFAIYNMADPANPVLIRQNITLTFDKGQSVYVPGTGFVQKYTYKFQTIKAGRYNSTFLLGTEW